MLTNTYRHARGRERALAVGDFLRFPIGRLGDEEVYRYRWEIEAFTPKGLIQVRRLHDGERKTLSAHWILNYLTDESDTDVRRRKIVEHTKGARERLRERIAYSPAASGKQFYVSVTNGESHRYLLGPYDSHDEADDKVTQAKTFASKVDLKACWYAYGVCSADAGVIPQTVFGR